MCIRDRAYQIEGSQMFEQMIKSIKEETVKLLFHVKVERAPERARVAQETAAIHAEGPGSVSEMCIRDSSYTYEKGDTWSK